MLPTTWEWIRILGLLAYFYFTVAVIFGLLRKSAFVQSQKNLIYHTHTIASWMGFATLIAHMLLLLIDKYEPYTVKELLIPFSSEYEPLFSTFGILGFYTFFIVMFTSDLLIKVLNRKLWKGIHFLVLPAWLLSLFHGMLIGTDTTNSLVMWFYIITAGSVILILSLRFMIKPRSINKKTTQTS